MRRNLKLKYRDTFGRAALSETSFYGYFTPILFYSAFHTWETQAFPEDLSPHPLPHSEKLTQQIPTSYLFYKWQCICLKTALSRTKALQQPRG